MTSIKKKDQLRPRVVTRLKGEVKILFFAEVEKTGETESNLLRHIVAKHYGNKNDRNHKMKCE